MGTGPLEKLPRPLQFGDLVLSRVAPCRGHAILIEDRQGSGDPARSQGRCAVLQKELPERGPGGLLLQEGVKARQIGDRPADSESVSSSLSPFPQRLGGSKLSPAPLGPILRIDHAAHPLILRATRPGLHEAQGVLKRAADAREIANPGEKAILDVVDAARERREVFSEHLSHQPRIASDLELREAGIRREGLKVHYLSSEVDDTVAQAPLQPSHALTEPAYPAHPVRLVPNVREAP